MPSFRQRLRIRLGLVQQLCFRAALDLTARTRAFKPILVLSRRAPSYLGSLRQFATEAERLHELHLLIGLTTPVWLAARIRSTGFYVAGKATRYLVSFPLLGISVSARPIQEIEASGGELLFTKDGGSLTMSSFPIFGANSIEILPTRIIPENYIARAKDVLVLMNNSTIFTRESSRKWTVWLLGSDQGLDFHTENFSAFFTKTRIGYALNRRIRAKPDHEMDCGAPIGTRFDFNYFHFMTEVLPRAVALDDHRVPPEVPIVLSPKRPQMLDMLSLVTNREVKLFDAHSLVGIKNAWLPSVPAHYPDDPAKMKESSLDLHAIRRVRKQLDRLCADMWRNSGSLIFISRGQLKYSGVFSGRVVTNESELLPSILQRGGQVIYPEKMTAREQVVAFASADIVVMPAGAAFANVIFCKKGTKVIVLTHNRNVNPEHFAMLAEACELDFACVAGEPLPGFPPGHGSYSIAAEDFDKALAWAESGAAAFDRPPPTDRKVGENAPVSEVKQSTS